jgi:hypothetical protein
MFCPSDSEWAELEMNYGYPIIEGARKGIIEITRAYLGDAQLEASAAPLAEAVAKLKKIKSAADELGAALQSRPPGAEDATLHVYARSVVINHLQIPTKPFLADRAAKDDFLRAICSNSKALSRACATALSQSIHSTPSFVRGDAWELWVRRLTDVCQAGALPTTARRDGYEPKTASASVAERRTRTASLSVSPFVLFLDRLQRLIPGKMRLHTQSLHALAGAVGKARKRSRVANAARASG